MSFLDQHIPFLLLVDLVEGRLAPEERERVQAHVSHCQQCAAEAAWLERVIGLMRTDVSEDAPAGVIARVRRLFADRRAPEPSGLRQRILAALRFDSAQLPLAYGLRAGQAAERQLLFNAGAIDLDVRLVQADEAWKVRGQVLGPEAEGEVELVGAGGTVRAALTEPGEFAFPPMPPGRYTLTLRFSNLEVEVADLNIG